VAQMEAISGKRPLVKYWMHVGFLTVGGQKMSKSLGNFITIADFLKRRTANQLRFLISKNLWRSPMDYTESLMIEVTGSVEKIEEFLRKIKSPAFTKATSGKQNSKLIKDFKTSFYEELDNDFNTPKAFAVMFDFINKVNALLAKNEVSKKQADEIYKFFQEINKIFGIIDFKKVTVKQTIPAEIKKLAKLREKARQEKDWQKSDELRKQIETQGFSVEDTPSGPVVRKI